MKTEPGNLLQKHPELVHSEMRKVISHVQRESGEWIVNTVMIEGCEVPFRYQRKKRYRSLQGQRVNLTYYPADEQVAGMTFEIMRVVRIRIA